MTKEEILKKNIIIAVKAEGKVPEDMIEDNYNAIMEEIPLFFEALLDAMEEYKDQEVEYAVEKATHDDIM